MLSNAPSRFLFSEYVCLQRDFLEVGGGERVFFPSFFRIRREKGRAIVTCAVLYIT